MSKPDKKWSLGKFFRKWYAPSARVTKQRKPTGECTLGKRENAVAIFERLMGEIPIGKIKTKHIEKFLHRLSKDGYRRSPVGVLRKRSKVSQQSILSEVLIVLAATGPKNGTNNGGTAMSCLAIRVMRHF